MSQVVTGRMTHQHEGELVVFHIGMQINRWWRPDLWLPAFLAMPRMLRELSTDKESGFLGYELLFGRGGPYVVQYWSSIDQLYAYASAPSQEHRPAWTAFNRAAHKAPGAVGVWHETFPRRASRERLRVDPVDGTGRCDGARGGRTPRRPRPAALRERAHRRFSILTPAGCGTPSPASGRTRPHRHPSEPAPVRTRTRPHRHPSAPAPVRTRTRPHRWKT
ncbi:hypothetical protein QF046_002096 [Microbacterium sp. W4I4]|uniref:DUF4188 domain-containing protein n=1 Tax=Microbacterium sp. W4I4 TaxID=3042295 RepID=UPI0027893195|nr:DUF4188 domain-containing protein [Microbacterium sp. W4I4]MDQ0614455.1 hypothetical protein [Microbacterium sp. W4I4]